ncbi:MAG: long-chain fatty acid--CoA ligase [Myxococcota bacterium]
MTAESTDLTRHLDRILAIDPDAPAVEFEGRAFAYRALAQAASALRCRLDAAGLPEGAAVGVVLRNDPAMLAALVALIGRRGCVVALNPHQGDERLARDVGELALPAVVALPRDWARAPLHDAVRATGALGLALSLDATSADSDATATAQGAVTPFAASSLADVEGCAFDPSRPHHPPLPGTAVQMLTSGTTGRPKRVALSLAAIAQSLLGAAHYQGGKQTSGDAARSIGQTSADPVGGSDAAADRTQPRPLALRRGVAIVSAPLVHIGGLWRVLQGLVDGRPIALLERFEVEAWRALVVRHRPATASLVPAALRMVHAADLPREELASLRAVVCGTAPLDPEEAERFEARYGIPVLTTYGATEFAGGVAGWTLDDHRRFAASKRGSVGRAHPGCALRVVDPESGGAVAAGEEGLLEVRSAQLGRDAGWIRTTDRAVLDADGFLFIRGRADAAIVRGGFKVHPDEVVKVLESHPAVAEAAVVGLADARLGAVPVAAVTLRIAQPRSGSGQAQASGDRVPDEAELRDHARRHLAAYQVPARIRIVEALPRTPSMKVSLAEVRALFGADGTA